MFAFFFTFEKNITHKILSPFPIKSAYSKTIVAITGICCIFLGLFTVLILDTFNKEKEIITVAKNDYIKEIEVLVQLNSDSYFLNVNNQSCWDELVAFTFSKDKLWFDELVYSEVDYYQFDYMSVFDVNGNLVQDFNSKKLKSSVNIPKQYFQNESRFKSKKYYLNTNDGIVEIYIASIHPSSDPNKNLTKSSGYFLMGRLVDRNFILNLEKITQSKVRLSPINIPLVGSNSTIAANVKLFDCNNKSISNLVFERESHFTFTNSKQILLIIFIVFFLNLLISLFFARKWFYIPFKLITYVLETGDRKSIKQLKKADDEFKHIGNLFEENIIQQHQLRKAKLKAEENDNLKSAFLANLSHEIRTPMNAILGFSDLLKDVELSPEIKANYINIIGNSGKNLISIIDDLIEMSKIDAKLIVPTLTDVMLDELLLDIYNTLKITIPKENNINFFIKKTNLNTNLCIETDEVKLKQILINLLTNAIKFTAEGYISFGYEIDKVNKVIIFEVIDTGIGIDAENKKLIFERFRTLDNISTEKVAGLGLGLAISKAYLKMLGGKIGVKSNIINGSIFTFEIPLVLSENQPKIEKSELVETIKPADKQLTILIAEDDNINFLLINKMLEPKKHVIIRAKNGLEAIDFCKNNDAIDLVLMDIKMPIFGGYEALEQIKEFRPKLNIIAQTAFSSADDIAKFKTAGFTDYITKPINRNKLFVILEKYC